MYYIRTPSTKGAENQFYVQILDIFFYFLSYLLNIR